MERIRIVIFEDLTVVREMLADLFGADERNEVVGVFADAAAGLPGIAAMHPHLAIVDFVLPDRNGLEVARAIRSTSPTTRIVILTAHDRPETLLEAVDAGVEGVVSKGSSVRVLKEAVSVVMNGGQYRCPRTAEALAKSRSVSLRDPLSDREREVLRLIASGHSTKQVAGELGISEKTATNHRTNLMRKLGVHDAVTLTRYAVERGLVESVPARKDP